MSIRSGKLVPAETSRTASVVNEDETSWTDVNLDEQREDQQRSGNIFIVVSILVGSVKFNPLRFTDRNRAYECSGFGGSR